MVVFKPPLQKKAEPPHSRQPGYLRRSVAFRPSLTAGLALSRYAFFSYILRKLLWSMEQSGTFCRLLDLLKSAIGVAPCGGVD